MKAPLSSWLRVRRRRWLIRSLALTAVLEGALIASGAPLRTDAAPWGIVSFEFAGTLSKADTMLASWEQKGVVAEAAFNLGLDYAFLLAYAFALVPACLAVVDLLKTRSAAYARMGGGIAWLPVVAACLDAVENTALVELVFGAQDAMWPGLAWGCALVKFILVGLSVLYVVVGLGLRLLRR